MTEILQTKHRCPCCASSLYTVDGGPPLCLDCGRIDHALLAEIIKHRPKALNWNKFYHEPVEGWGG